MIINKPNLAVTRTLKTCFNAESLNLTSYKRPLFGGWMKVVKKPEFSKRHLHVCKSVVNINGSFNDHVIILETNIDDMSPQIIAYVMDLLLKEGALDVWSVNALMKKGRPGHILSVLCKPETMDKLLKIIFHETTTLGIRMLHCSRATLDRSKVNIVTSFGEVSVKIGYLHGKIVTWHAEYEECANLARAKGIPLKVVFEEVHRQFLNEHYSSFDS